MPKVVYEAIRRNKHVVTANKALVATYLGEIQQLLKDHPGVTFGYEAAVCGGESKTLCMGTVHVGSQCGVTGCSASEQAERVGRALF